MEPVGFLFSIYQLQQEKYWFVQLTRRQTICYFDQYKFGM